MTINGINGIAQAIQQKNAAGIKSATPSANQGSMLSGMQDLERIASDDNAQATPAINAGDIDVLALKMLEYEKTFDILMPGLDEIKYKVDAMFEMFQQTQGAQQQPPVPPVTGV